MFPQIPYTMCSSVVIFLVLEDASKTSTQEVSFKLNRTLDVRPHTVYVGLEEEPGMQYLALKKTQVVCRTAVHTVYMSP